MFRSWTTPIALLIVTLGTAGCTLPDTSSPATAPTIVAPGASATPTEESASPSPEVLQPTATVPATAVEETPAAAPETATPLASPTLAASSPASTPSAPGETDAPYETVFTVPVGPDGVAYRGADVAEMQESGPESFALGPDGSFWIADTIGATLQQYGPDGERLKVIDVADYEANTIVDLAAGPSSMLALDIYVALSRYRVLRLSYEGELLEVYELPEGLHLTNGLSGIAQGDDGEVWVELEAGYRLTQLVDAAGTVEVKPLEGYTHGGQLYQQVPGEILDPYAAYRAGDTIVYITGTHAIGGVSLAGVTPDQRFALKVEEVNLDTSAGVAVDQTVRLYDGSGALLGLARVPLSEQFAYVSHPVVLAPDGTVYALLTRPDHIEIARLNFFPELAPILGQPGS